VTQRSTRCLGVVDVLQFMEYGFEGSVLTLQTCLEYLKTDLKNIQLEPVLVSVFKFVLDKPNSSTVFCQSLRSLEITENFLEKLSNSLKLSVAEKIGIGLALTDAENADTRMFGELFVYSSFFAPLLAWKPLLHLLMGLLFFQQRSFVWLKLRNCVRILF